jgi:hypothetical protein
MFDQLVKRSNAVWVWLPAIQAVGIAKPRRNGEIIQA